MKVFPSFLQLHGKTYDYKIPYTSVLRLFLLPHKDQRFMFFVVSNFLSSNFLSMLYWVLLLFYNCGQNLLRKLRILCVIFQSNFKIYVY